EAAHVGDVDQAELVVRGQHNVAHMQGAEIHAQLVQVGDEFGQPGKQLKLVKGGVAAQQLAQRLAGQGLVVNDRAVGLAQAIQLDDFRAGDAQALQLGGVVR